MTSETALGISLTWQLDALGVFFALVILGISLPVTVFAIGHRGHHGSYPGASAFYVIFIAAMVGTVAAADAYTFLIAWETMTLASFAPSR